MPGIGELGISGPRYVAKRSDGGDLEHADLLAVDMAIEVLALQRLCAADRALAGGGHCDGMRGIAMQGEDRAIDLVALLARRPPAANGFGDLPTKAMGSLREIPIRRSV